MAQNNFTSLLHRTWRLIEMSKLSLMILQFRVFHETFTAAWELAHVRSKTAMTPNVPSQVCLVDVSFCAHVTLVVSLSSVNSHMNLEFLLIGKSFAASEIITHNKDPKLKRIRDCQLTSHTDYRRFSDVSICCGISTAI